MSIACKGKIISDATRKKLSDALKGKTRSDEHRKNLSESIKKGGKCDGENNPYYGKIHSEETRNKIKIGIKKYYDDKNNK